MLANTAKMATKDSSFSKRAPERINATLHSLEIYLSTNMIQKEILKRYVLHQFMQSKLPIKISPIHQPHTTTNLNKKRIKLN